MIERAKNVIIAALFLSLIGLTLLNWFYWGDNDFTAAFTEESGRGAFYDAARPVSGDFDRYQESLVVFLAVADESASLDRRAWDAALESGGTHFEFLFPTPVWLIAEGLSFTASDIFDGVLVREMILTGGGLFVYDGDKYMGFSSTSQPTDFPEPIVGEEDSGNHYLAVTLFRIFDDPYFSELLESLGFNPNTRSKYKQAGDWVVIDDERNLRVSANGLVVYHDGTNYEDNEPIDEREAVKMCLGKLPLGAAFWGDGQLVYNSVTELDDGFDVFFSYTLGGAVFLDRTTAFAIRGGVLRSAVIRLTPAFFDVTSVRLIPEHRASVLVSEGKKLCVGYSPGEDGTWIPDWYARD